MFVELDIGATNTRISISEDLQSLTKVKKIPTNFNFPEAMGEIREVITHLSGGRKITAAAGGVRALNPDKKKLRDHPRIPLWVNAPLHVELQKGIDGPLFLETDTLMGALGEAHFGAGENYNNIAYVTISSGVGGARIVKEPHGLTHASFEPGAQVIAAEGGISTYLSNLISGTALEKKYGVRAEQILDPQVWDTTAQYLSYGINNLAAFWAPEVIILGGGVMRSISIERVNDYFREVFKASDIIPDIKCAALGDGSGLYGAMAYLKWKGF